MAVTINHILTLARACIKNMQLDPDYGCGIQMDGKRPFGNSGRAALFDTLDAAGVILPEDMSEDDTEEYLEYARNLWREMPIFLAKYCILTLKEE